MRASFSRHRRWQNHIITGAYLLSRYNNNNSSIRYLFLNLELNRSPVLILSNNELTSHLRERERGGGYAVPRSKNPRRQKRICAHPRYYNRG